MKRRLFGSFQILGHLWFVNDEIMKNFIEDANLVGEDEDEDQLPNLDLHSKVKLSENLILLHKERIEKQHMQLEPFS